MTARSEEAQQLIDLMRDAAFELELEEAPPARKAMVMRKWQMGGKSTWLWLPVVAQLERNEDLDDGEEVRIPRICFLPAQA